MFLLGSCEYAKAVFADCFRTLGAESYLSGVFCLKYLTKGQNRQKIRISAQIRSFFEK
jgi:hypothetical protein